MGRVLWSYVSGEVITPLTNGRIVKKASMLGYRTDPILDSGQALFQRHKTLLSPHGQSQVRLRPGAVVAPTMMDGWEIYQVFWVPCVNIIKVF